MRFTSYRRAVGALDPGQPVPKALADARVKSLGHGAKRIGGYWSEGDALLVFIRHFACAGCSEHVTELSPRLAELDALGVKTVIIGCGSVDQLTGFMERHQLFDKRVEVT